jgi:F420-non-reducing hydrogenase iron-sulfur subunit
MKYPPNVLPIRVMCSGRVDPTFVLKALKEGADGVLIAGCHPGDCHYTSGNYRALGRYTLLKKMIEQLGVGLGVRGRQVGARGEGHDREDPEAGTAFLAEAA